MASTKPWTPAPGRHKVNIGSSLGRALKVRKGNPPPPKRSNLPDRDFYALRCNFKPNSIDTTKSGNMEVKKNKEGNSNITVEHPAQPNGFHVYRGREDPAKEWACVLIFDEETGNYTLEKIESFVALEYAEKRTDSLLATAQPSTSSNNERSSPQVVVKEQGNEADFDINAILDDLVDSSRQAAKDEPDSEEDFPIQRSLPPRPQTLPPKPTKSSTSKSKARPTPVEPPAPPPLTTSSAPVPSNKSKKASKRPTPEFSDVEEEILDPKPTKRTRPTPPSPQPPQPAPISKPPPQPKRATSRKQPSPPPKPRAALELPGSSGSFIPPPIPSSASTSRQPPEEATFTAPPVIAAITVEPPASISAVASDSEEDEWDEVAAPEGVSDRIMMIEETGEEEENENENENENEGDGGIEIDVDEFENLMNEHLGEDGNGNVEDEDDRFGIFPDSPELQTQALSPMPPLPRAGGGPISLNAFAGGGGDQDDDDEYSSSEEESDDD